jgi:hypothetical protein
MQLARTSMARRERPPRYQPAAIIDLTKRRIGLRRRRIALSDHLLPSRPTTPSLPGMFLAVAVESHENSEGGRYVDGDLATEGHALPRNPHASARLSA